MLFSVKFVPAERVKYAGACEIACGSEMRFAREGNEFYFTSTEERYFTIHEVNDFPFGGAVAGACVTFGLCELIVTHSPSGARGKSPAPAPSRREP